MRRLALLCVALLAAGCYDSRFGERGDDATPEPVTATIRQLREKFAGTTFPVTGDIVVSGRVTTSDYDENFYRTFCIEEDGAGIEVMAGIDHLHNDFPEGCQVTLRLRGLALGESHGVLQAGRMPAAGKRVRNRLHRVESGAGCGGDPQRGSPETHSPYPAVARRTDAGAMRHAGADRGAKLHPGRPYARDMGRIQTFHGRRRRGGLHLCTQLRPVCGRRGTRRPLYAHGNPAIRRHRGRALHSQTAR